MADPDLQISLKGGGGGEDLQIRRGGTGPPGPCPGSATVISSWTGQKNFYRAFSLTCPVSMQIYWKKRKFLHNKRVQLPQDWFETPTWPPFHCFGTPIWPPWRHEKTLYRAKVASSYANLFRQSKGFTWEKVFNSHSTDLGQQHGHCFSDCFGIPIWGTWRLMKRLYCRGLTTATTCSLFP